MEKLRIFESSVIAYTSITELFVYKDYFCSGKSHGAPKYQQTAAEIIFTTAIVALSVYLAWGLDIKTLDVLYCCLLAGEGTMKQLAFDE